MPSLASKLVKEIKVGKEHNSLCKDDRHYTSHYLLLVVKIVLHHQIVCYQQFV
jgi:hypothetical protein